MTARQYRMLLLFSRRDYDIDQALDLDQRTFGSLCRRGWVDFYYGSRARFIITENGRAMFEHHHDWTMKRSDPSRPFSSFVSSGAKRIAERHRKAMYA